MYRNTSKTSLLSNMKLKITVTIEKRKYLKSNNYKNRKNIFIFYKYSVVMKSNHIKIIFSKKKMIKILVSGT